MGLIEGILIIGVNGMNVLNAWRQGQERLEIIRDQRAALKEQVAAYKVGAPVAVETSADVLPPVQAAPRVARQGKPSQVTTQETVAYQNRELAKTLLVLETHLSQGCEIAGKVCDCCSPRHPLEIQKLAEEAIGMTGDPDGFYGQVVALGRLIEAQAAIERLEQIPLGERKRMLAPLAEQCRTLRKRAMAGNEAVDRLMDRAVYYTGEVRDGHMSIQEAGAALRVEAKQAGKERENG
jgi:hypothetical protein